MSRRTLISLVLTFVLSACGGSSHDAVVPGSSSTDLQTMQSTQSFQNTITSGRWRIYRRPSTGQVENVYSWPLRDGSIIAYGTTCCYPGGGPPSGTITGITTSGASVKVTNGNPPISTDNESVPMPLFPCAQGTQICSIDTYYVFGPNRVTYYFRNQSAPAAVAGAGNDVWFTVCCNQTYIVRGSNGSMHYYRTPHSLTDKTQQIARTADGKIWVTLQHAGSTSWILARLNPLTSVVTEFPLQLPAPPKQLIVGSDGNIWFALAKTLYRVAAYNAQVTRFPLPQPSTGYLANGPHATIWTPYVLSQNAQGLMETQITGALVGAFPCPLSVCARDPAGDTIQQITEGPDGAIWFPYSNTTMTNPSPPDDLYEGIAAYAP